MLLALLYDHEDCIRGAALACEQQPYGDRFWFDYYPGDVGSTRQGLETAHVEIADEDLSARLLAMQVGEGFANGQSAAEAVAAHLRQVHSARLRRPPRAA